MAMRRIGSDEGAGLIEYALVVALIALVALGAIGFVGDEVSGVFGDAGTALEGNTQVNPPSQIPRACNPPPGQGVGWSPPPGQNCP